MFIYIILIVTFILLGIVSFLNRIKEGIIASCVGVAITTIIGLIHFVVSKVNNFFGKYDITMKDLFIWLFIIALAIIAFLVLAFIIRMNGNNRYKK